MVLKKVCEMLLCHLKNTAWYFTKPSIDVLCGMVFAKYHLNSVKYCLMKWLVFRKECVLFIVFSLINFPGSDHVRHCKDHFASCQKGTYRKRPQCNFEKFEPSHKRI